jgi:integrase
VEDGRPLPNDRLTVEKYLDWWIAEHVPGRVKPRTLLSYEQKVRHVKRLLGRVRLWSLTATQVESAFNQLLDEGHSPGGVQAIRRVFRVAMKEADRKDLVRKNVVALADGPKAVDKPRDPYTVDEVKAIRAEMEGDRLMALFFVGLALALREGEAFGLRWSDVDLKRGLVHIRHQVQPKRGGGFEFDDPKTLASIATLELTKNQVAILRRHRREQAKERLIAGSEWMDYDLVFPSAIGTPYSASNVRRRFNKICEQAKVRPRRIHDWRVTTGSWLADLNVHPEVAKQVMRHSQHSTTMKYYTHAKSERRGEALEALDDMFNG